MLEQIAGAMFGLLIFLAVMLEIVWACPCRGSKSKNQKIRINMIRLGLIVSVLAIFGYLNNMESIV